MLDLMNEFIMAIKGILTFPPLNVALMQKILNNNHVSENIIDAVIGDLLSDIKDSPLDERLLETVFSRYDIESLASTTYSQLQKDTVVLPYGSIGCP